MHREEKVPVSTLPDKVSQEEAEVGCFACSADCSGGSSCKAEAAAGEGKEVQDIKKKEEVSLQVVVSEEQATLKSADPLSSLD